MVGIIENIIYKSNEDYMICTIRSSEIPKEYRNEFDPYYCTILGTMSVLENLRYDFNGKWIYKEDYGWELKVEDYKEIEPDGKDRIALIAYLQSGLFTGIGEKMAQRIVDKFKDETLNIIKNDPNRLSEVKGISTRKAIAIYECYLKNQQYQELMLILKPYNISNRKIIKIAEKYGFNAVNVLKSNPYIVCKEIEGFGFLTADSLAMASGLNRKDKNRVKEGIKYCLEESAQKKGNLYLTKKMLGTNLSKILNTNLSNQMFLIFRTENGRNPSEKELNELIAKSFVDEESVMIALEELRLEREVYLEYENSKFLKKTNIYEETGKEIINLGAKEDTFTIEEYVNKNCIRISYNGDVGYINPRNCSAIQFDCYASLYYNCEVSSAKHINRLLYSTKIKIPKGNVGSVLEKLEKKNDIKYADKQKDAIIALLKKNFLVVTGGPGTGKTTTLKGMIETYRHFFPTDDIILAAPTGRAAKRMSEATGETATTIHRLLEYIPNMGFQRNEDNPIEADVIIIDESSMVDILLFVSLLKAIPTNCKLVLVGDVDQLPSVGPGMVLKDVIASKKVQTIYLNEIFRQANTSKIVINAFKINNNDKDLEFSPDFAYYRYERNEYPNLQDDVLDKLCELYRKELEENGGNVNDVQVLVPFRAKRKISVDSLNKILAPIANPRPDNEISLQYGENTFRINDKVMQMKNNYEKNVFNGDIGFIKEIYKDENGYKMFVDFGLGNPVLYDDFDELVLAYASTIHKSQGSEYPMVIIPILKEQEFFLQKCILYTAVTRAKKKCALIGEYPALMTAIGRNNISDRKTKLTSRIDIV